MLSLDGAKTLTNIKADFIYIDASHYYKDVIDDLNAWHPFLNENGIICGDDWDWGENGDVK